MFYSRSSRQSTSCHSGVISVILVAKEDNVYFIVGLCSGTGTRSLDGNLLHSFERSWELRSLIVRLKLCGTCWWDSGGMVERPPTGPHRRPLTCSTWCACRCCMLWIGHWHDCYYRSVNDGGWDNAGTSIPAFFDGGQARWRLKALKKYMEFCPVSSIWRLSLKSHETFIDSLL